MSIPEDILNKLRTGECILFLGSMASAPSPAGSLYQYQNAPPGGSELSRQLAEACNYPFEDKTNLQRVSLYFEHREENGVKVGSRQALVQAIQRIVTANAAVPSPALHMLAALPFRIIITTNYDSLFDIALTRASTVSGQPKVPQVRVYDPNRPGPPEQVPLDPKENEPILLKLHGDFGHPDSLVVTEEDYIIFVERMSDLRRHPIHEFIRARISSWPVLFVGYSLKDYNLRLLFRTLRWNLDAASFPLSFSVDPYPDDLIVAVWQHVKPIVSFVRQNLWDFVPELYREIRGVEYPHGD